MSSEHETTDWREMVTTRPLSPSAAAATTLPDITLRFDGLFYICFAEPKDGKIAEAQIGILSTVLSHELSITISGTLNGTTRVSSLYAFDRPTLRLIESIVFGVEGHTDGITIFSPDINRLDHEHNPESFQWAIDFENTELFGKKVDIRRGIFKPVMFVRAGEFFTDRVTVQTSYDKVDINGARTRFGFVAETIGVRLNLPDKGKAMLDVGGHLNRLFARSATHPLGLSTPFTIHFDNRCPRHKPPSSTNEPVPVPSDLHFYYQALDVRADEWLDLQPTDTGAPGAPPAICFPATGSRTRTIPV